MTEQEYNQRKAGYLEEWSRIRNALKTKEPKAEEYKILLARLMNVEKIIADLDKAWFAESMRLNDFDLKSRQNEQEEAHKQQEFEFKQDKEQFEEELKRKQLEQEEAYRQKEFEFRMNKERFEEELKRKQLEQEEAYKQRQFEQEQKAAAEKMQNDIKIEAIKSAESVGTTVVKGCFGVAQSLIAGKVMLAMAKGILSDEEGGKLVLSKILGLISKPNVWTIRV